MSLSVQFHHSFSEDVNLIFHLYFLSYELSEGRFDFFNVVLGFLYFEFGINEFFDKVLVLLLDLLYSWDDFNL